MDAIAATILARAKTNARGCATVRTARRTTTRAAVARRMLRAAAQAVGRSVVPQIWEPAAVRALARSVVPVTARSAVARAWARIVVRRMLTSAAARALTRSVVPQSVAARVLSHSVALPVSSATAQASTRNVGSAALAATRGDPTVGDVTAGPAGCRTRESREEEGALPGRARRLP